MHSPSFDLFEFVCTELRDKGNCFITNEDLGVGTEETTGGRFDNLLDSLKKEHDVPDNQAALGAAFTFLEHHFQSRRSRLPFTCDLNTREFRALDGEFIRFIAEVSGRRGAGGDYAKEFENAACLQLRRKVTGTVHNVGWPRRRLKKAAQFKQYLCALGFDDRVVLGKERDAGLDLIWIPPLGKNPVAPVVSVQCKNGLFSRSVARESTARTSETLSCHRMLRGSSVQLSAILFNDYIEPEKLPNKPIAYIPLGLSDLAATGETEVVEI